MGADGHCNNMESWTNQPALHQKILQFPGAGAQGLREHTVPKANTPASDKIPDVIHYLQVMALAAVD